MQAATIAETVANDWWPGMTLADLTYAGSPWDLSAASVLMQLRRSKCSTTAAQEWSTTDGTITVSGASSDTLTVAGALIELDPGIYHWDLQVIPESGQTVTLIGGTWSLAADVSRPSV